MITVILSESTQASRTQNTTISRTATNDAFPSVQAGISGALYTVQSGIVSPQYMAVPFSIEMVIWVAVGGRGIDLVDHIRDVGRLVVARHDERNLGAGVDHNCFVAAIGGRA